MHVGEEPGHHPVHNSDYSKNLDRNSTSVKLSNVSHNNKHHQFAVPFIDLS